ncbi:Binding-protein-dependent transporters inner membrane component (fragment) [uncultured Spirochaetota bacterium]
MNTKKTTKAGGKYLLLALILLWSGAPILMVILSSFKDARFIFEFPPKIFFKPTFENYSYLAETWPEFFSSLWNSTLVTIGSALLTVVVSFFAGYAYSRFHSRRLTMSAFFCW